MHFTKKLFKHSFLGIYATRILKGCLFLFTILVSVSDSEMTTLHLMAYILISFGVMTIIDIYCQFLGDQIRFRRSLSVPEIWSLVGEFLPQCLPGIFAILVFLFPFLHIISQNIAFDIIEVGCMALMILFCYASQRLVGRKGWRAAWPTLLAACVGVGFVFLRGRLS